MGMLVFYAGNFLEACFVLFAGFFGKTGAARGVFVVQMWWIAWERWFVGGRFFEGGIFAGFWDLFCEPVGEEQATAKTKYRDPSTRRFAPSLRVTTKNKQRQLQPQVLQLHPLANAREVSLRMTLRC
jgi:hypothetical protein